MDRIFNDAKDKNVSALVVYGKSGDTKAYVDSDCKVQMKTSELKEAFLKRAVIIIGEEMFIPVAYNVASNAGTVTYAKAGSTATTATLTAAKD